MTLGQLARRLHRRAGHEGAGTRGEIEALLRCLKDVALAGATARTAVRVRYDRERRTYLVMLDGFDTVAAAPGALSAQAVKR